MSPALLLRPKHPHLIPQVLALLALLSKVLAAPADVEPDVADLDPEDNDSIEQFEEHFHLPKVRWFH